MVMKCPPSGKVKWKMVPPFGRRFEPDAAAMSLDDRPADRQADAHPALLGRDKRLKQLGRDGFADPPPLSSMLTRMKSGGSGAVWNCEASHRAVHHGVDCIADQVDEHLLNLDAVDEHLIGVRVELDVHFNAMLVRTDQSERIRLRDEPCKALDFAALFRRD